MAKTFLFAIPVLLIFTGCKFSGKPDPGEPQYDIKTMRMIMEIGIMTHASGLSFGSTTVYNTNEDNDKWIKLSLTNPVIKEDEELFRKKMAFYIAMHLKNRGDFEKIEVSVTNKAGGMVSISRSTNSFFYIDSLYN